MEDQKCAAVRALEDLMPGLCDEAGSPYEQDLEDRVVDAKYAPTAPEAICRAALACKGLDPGDGRE